MGWIWSIGMSRQDDNATTANEYTSYKKIKTPN